MAADHRIRPSDARFIEASARAAILELTRYLPAPESIDV
jgi:hypothetical protein